MSWSQGGYRFALRFTVIMAPCNHSFGGLVLRCFLNHGPAWLGKPSNLDMSLHFRKMTLLSQGLYEGISDKICWICDMCFFGNLQFWERVQNTTKYPPSRLVTWTYCLVERTWHIYRRHQQKGSTSSIEHWTWKRWLFLRKDYRNTQQLSCGTNRVMEWSGITKGVPSETHQALLLSDTLTFNCHNGTPKDLYMESLIIFGHTHLQPRITSHCSDYIIILHNIAWYKWA